MTNKTINEFTALSGSVATDDQLLVWDTSAGATRKISQANLVGGAITGNGTIATGGFTLTVPATGTAALWTYGSSWTPALKFGGGTTGMTYSSRSGKYAIIGDRIVVAAFAFTLSAKGSSTGNATLDDLPVTGISGNMGAVFWRYINQMSSLTGPIVGFVGTGNTSMGLAQVVSGNNSNLTEANFSNSSTLEGIVVYFK
jgi:hypothetical protein